MAQSTRQHLEPHFFIIFTRSKYGSVLQASQRLPFSRRPQIFKVLTSWNLDCQPLARPSQHVNTWSPIFSPISRISPAPASDVNLQPLALLGFTLIPSTASCSRWKLLSPISLPHHSSLSSFSSVNRQFPPSSPFPLFPPVKLLRFVVPSIQCIPWLENLGCGYAVPCTPWFAPHL